MLGIAAVAIFVGGVLGYVKFGHFDLEKKDSTFSKGKNKKEFQILRCLYHSEDRSIVAKLDEESFTMCLKYQ